ncbi:MAG: acetyl-CoA carboxylase carboxyltransferase subunit beta [Alphaproteobacteria bacterium]|nr:acetyl-CoA carboxylase carboxyltransferase subunit beta [Alphaproteobacteria bacterium]
MNWLSNLPPGIKNIFKRQDQSSDTLWVKCPACGDMIFHRDLEAAQQVCPSCGHHMRISPTERLKRLFDEGEYESIALPEPALDPLKFRDEKKYVDRLKEYRKKTGRSDAMEVAVGSIEGAPAVVAVQDFAFMGGSMGMALGEALICAAEEAVRRRRPLVVFTASGGARMQEGILSLMQMPRTTIAVEMMREARLPYIVVFTDPTTGGVTASYAMLGDVHIAEPGALIGFAGPRVIEQTIRETLPEGFQRAEFLRDKGMVDLVVPRTEMRSTLSRLLRVLMKDQGRIAQIAPPPREPAKAITKKNKQPEESVPLDKAAE